VPPTYKELDSRKDRARLNELKAESEGRPLTAAESFEQRHLQARLAVCSPTRDSADKSLWRRYLYAPDEEKD
jgi:hypothetical protein